MQKSLLFLKTLKVLKKNIRIKMFLKILFKMYLIFKKVRKIKINYVKLHLIRKKCNFS